MKTEQSPDLRAGVRIRVAWTLYDFANSAYVLTVIAFAFPLFFRSVLAQNSPHSDFLWGLALGSSVIGAGLLGPWVGRYADRHGVHRPLFRTCVLVASIGMTGFLFLTRGQIALGFGLFVISNASFSLATAIYDSYLKTIAGQRPGWISGLAWGVGYLGGIGCLLLVFPWVRTLDAEQLSAYRVIFAVTAVWYACFSAPLLLLMPATKPSPPAIQAKFHPSLAKFYVGYFLLTDATGTLTNFASIFARETLQMSSTTIGALLLYVQVVGVPATIISGRLADRWGAKRVVISGAAGWAMVCVWMLVATSAVEFYAVCTLMGLVVGSTYSAARTMLARVAPPGRAGEAFGLNLFSGRIAEAIAPLVFGSVSSATGSQRLGVAAMLPFLLSGIVLLSQVRSNSTLGPSETT